MYAVIELKGKQFHVSPNQTIYVDLLGSAMEGESLQVKEVLAMGGDSGLRVGTPYVDGASVSLSVEKVVKGEKLIAFKYKHNKNSKTKKGHRQKYHKVTVTDIQG